MLRKDQIGCYKYWKAPLKKTNHLVPLAEHVERNPVKKNWKTPLNKDDNSQIKSFLSLVQSGSFNITREKNSIRSYVANRRFTLSDLEVEERSSKISKSLSTLESYKLSKSIALYSPILNEVRTQSIFEEAVGAEKEVYFPRVNGSSLDFHRIEDLCQLKAGKFRVLEPERGLFKADLRQIDLFIIPGLTFDNSGNRLGYGKGYYDRVLANIPEIKKVGLCYDFQLLDSVPADQNDKRVGVIVTDRGIVFSRRNTGGK